MGKEGNKEDMKGNNESICRQKRTFMMKSRVG
jgi:hypothetical protein